MSVAQLESAIDHIVDRTYRQRRQDPRHELTRTKTERTAQRRILEFLCKMSEIKKRAAAGGRPDKKRWKINPLRVLEIYADSKLKSPRNSRSK